MARGINKVILIGNLGRDPETRYTQDQRPVTNFSVATSESWRDRETNEQNERTEWHDIVCFQRLAEIAGAPVYFVHLSCTEALEQVQSARSR